MHDANPALLESQKDFSLAFRFSVLLFCFAFHVLFHVALIIFCLLLFFRVSL